MNNLVYTLGETRHSIPFEKHNFTKDRYRDLENGDIEFIVPQSQEATRIELLNLLKVWADCCENNDIQWWAIGGTLIGSLRHGGLIPWDNDVDVGIKFRDYKRIRKLTGDDYEAVISPGYILSKAMAGLRLRRKMHSTPFLDVFVYDIMPEFPDRYGMAGPIAKMQDGTYLKTFYAADFWTKCWFRLGELDWSRKNVRTAQFEDRSVPVPYNAKRAIRRHFGEDVMTNMYYTPNELIHTSLPMMLVLTSIERSIDHIIQLAHVAGLDTTTLQNGEGKRARQMNFTGFLFQKVCDVAFDEDIWNVYDIQSKVKVLKKAQRDWVTYVVERMKHSFEC